MLTKYLLPTALAATLLFSMNATAGFVETDWQVIGDKKATLHQETGLEWLDLSVTGGKTINEVKAMLTTSLIGWRLPTFNEIKQLAAALAPVKQSPEYHYGTGAGVYANEFKMLGANIPNYYYGIYEKDNDSYGLSLYTTASPAANTLTSDAYFYLGYRLKDHSGAYRGGSTGLDVYRVYEGVYLVSDGGTTLSSISNPTLNANNPNAPINNTPVAAVSAPAVFGGMALSLMALFGRNKRRR